MLVLLSDVIFLAQVDQVYNRLSGEKEKRINSLNLITTLLAVAQPMFVKNQSVLLKSERVSYHIYSLRLCWELSTSWGY